MTWRIVQGDCLAKMRDLPDCSVDACVTDPPYGLHFMGKKWDCEVPGVDVWREVLRVLKPGGHLLCFAGTRTQHRMCCAIEDAGFEIRDMIAWVYGSGFPKSRNLDGEWQGWGTALKPALEPITVARKPLDGTVAGNVLQWGTGAINVDGGRVGIDGGTQKGNPPKGASNGIFGNGINGACDIVALDKGRWPANLIHDGSPEVLELFPYRPGMSGGGKHKPGAKPGMFGAIDCEHTARGDNGSAARFFYCAKANKRERDDGLGEHHNCHPTVKPTDLMRYLCRLVTPPGGLVLDPFAGSGSTGRGAVLEGFSFIGIEREHDYADIAAARLEAIECQSQ